MQPDEKTIFHEEKIPLFTWFLLTFLFGLGLRVWKLGGMSFTLAEAQAAQNAWMMALGNAAELPGSMSYAGLSAILFRLFEPSSFLARLIPVLSGSVLVLVPWFWRDRLGDKTALVLAVGLAIDPILLTFSRQIITPVIVLSALALAATALRYKRPVLAGVFFGAAFLGGYTFWVAAVVGAVYCFVSRKDPAAPLDFSVFRDKAFLIRFLTAFVLSLASISSAFLLSPNGLGGIAGGLVELVKVLGEPYKLELYQPIIIGIAYSLLPLLFAVWEFVSNLQNKQPTKNLPYLIAWGVSVLLSVLLGRLDLGFLAFAVVFAWLGAAEGISRLIEQKTEQQEIVFGVTLFQIVIMGYILMVSRRLTSVSVGSQDFRFSALAVFAGVLLMVISTILVTFGWRRQVSTKALQNSLLIMLLVVTLGIGLRSINSGSQSATLSVLAGPILLPNNDVAAAVHEIDRNGMVDKAEITYDLGDLKPDFSWFFRYQDDWESSKSVLQADLVLSTAEQSFSAADEYRGRNVVLYRQIDQPMVKPIRFLETLLGEPLPMTSTSGILWVRLNLFTGAN